MSENITIVIIPQSDLDKLELARQELFKILKNDPDKIDQITYNVSNIMYKLTHTKYPKRNLNYEACKD